MSRKRTSKRENKRLDSKKARAAERAALKGGPAKVVRAEKWTVKDDRQPPLLDDAPQGTPQRKKSKKEIKYCPAREKLGEGKKRHYFIEKEVEIPPYEWEVNPQPRFSKEKRCMYCSVKRAKGGWGNWRWARTY